MAARVGLAGGGQDRTVKRMMVKKESLDRTIDEEEKIGRKPAPREWAKWAGYDCGE